MNVLFTLHYPLWTHNFVSELSLILQNTKETDIVYLLECTGEYKHCECNQSYDIIKCFECNKIYKKHVVTIPREIIILPAIYRKSLVNIPKQVLHDRKQLSEFSYNGFDAGIAVLSSLYDRFRHPKCSLEGLENVITGMIQSACDSFETAELYINKYKIDKIFIFNGRFTHVKPWLRAAQKHKIPFVCHERGGTSRKAFIFENDIPHNINKHFKLIEKTWHDNGNTINHADCQNWFQERITGGSRNWESFVTNQKSGLVGNLTGNKKPISIFLSTDYEFASISDDFDDSPLPIQEDFLDLLLERLTKEVDLEQRIIIRVHPNSTNTNNRFWNKYKNYDINKILILDPESPVSSYELLSKSEKVVTFGSTIGVEATYMGIPSVLLGPASYRGLGCCYEPDSLDEAIKIIQSKLKPMPIENALKYSAWMIYGGVRLEHIEYHGIHDIRFNPNETKQKPGNLLNYIYEHLTVYRHTPIRKQTMLRLIQKLMLNANSFINRLKERLR